MANKDDFFSGAFDFNSDGKTDLGEKYIAYKICEDCTSEDGVSEGFVSNSGTNTTDNTYKNSSPIMKGFAWLLAGVIYLLFMGIFEGFVSILSATSLKDAALGFLVMLPGVIIWSVVFALI